MHELLDRCLVSMPYTVAKPDTAAVLEELHLFGGKETYSPHPKYHDEAYEILQRSLAEGWAVSGRISAVTESSLRAVVCGFNPTSGPGYPECKRHQTKKDYVKANGGVDGATAVLTRFLRQVLECEDPAQLPAYWLVHGKEDKYKAGKLDRMRTIQGSSIQFQFVHQAYFKEVEEWLHQRPTWMTSFNPAGTKWSNRFKQLVASGPFSGGHDATGWDRNVPGQAIYAYYDLLATLVEVPDNVLAWLKYHSVHSLLVVPGGDPQYEGDTTALILQKHRGNPSGHPGTIHINSLVHELFMIAVSLEVGTLHYDGSVVTGDLDYEICGDDNVYFGSREAIETMLQDSTLQLWRDRYGVVLKKDGPYEHGSLDSLGPHAEFLSRFSVLLGDRLVPVPVNPVRMMVRETHVGPDDSAEDVWLRTIGLSDQINLWRAVDYARPNEFLVPEVKAAEQLIRLVARRCGKESLLPRLLPPAGEVYRVVMETL